MKLGKFPSQQKGVQDRMNFDALFIAKDCERDMRKKKPKRCLSWILFLFVLVTSQASFAQEGVARRDFPSVDWLKDCTSDDFSRLTPSMLESIATRLHGGSLTEQDFELLPCINQDELEIINNYLEEFRVLSLEEAIPLEENVPSPDGCETILCHTIQGYRYVLPYTYWYKWEWNGWDLMLEYRYWPASCSTRGAKAFYVNPWSLCDALEPCGIVVYSDRMEPNCTRRITAVVGFSSWPRFGGAYTASHTWLGFSD